MKRYSIVRVDNQCPFGYEKQNEKAFLSRCLTSTFQCKDCYGDTKEQLTRKIAQASINYYESRVYSKVNFQDMARWILEFLGVK